MGKSRCEEGSLLTVCDKIGLVIWQFSSKTICAELDGVTFWSQFLWLLSVSPDAFWCHCCTEHKYIYGCSCHGQMNSVPVDVPEDCWLFTCCFFISLEVFKRSQQLLNVNVSSKPLKSQTPLGQGGVAVVSVHPWLWWVWLIGASQRGPWWCVLQFQVIKHIRELVLPPASQLQFLSLFLPKSRQELEVDGIRWFCVWLGLHSPWTAKC